ncbi:hypothetical protein KC968_00625 [Candidatus Saccharibacteria bacterium]|nr:hypothetical protein [Candidatus Saccharibacteria bacterium]
MPEIFHNPSYNPEVGPELREAGRATDDSARISSELIGHIDQGAVPLLSSVEGLEPHDQSRVIDAIINSPNPSLAESMDEQVKRAVQLNQYDDRK